MIVRHKDNEIPIIVFTKKSEKEKLVIELLALDDECIIKNRRSTDRDIIETLSTHLYILYEGTDFKKYGQFVFADNSKDRLSKLLTTPEVNGSPFINLEK